MKVLFFTGAGISANAGIPVYRDEGSSWVDSDLEEKSHSNRYGNHLDELWDKHWGPTQSQMNAAEPTHAHKAIAEFQKNHEVVIATQNIELLHERAGSDNIAHLHGDMSPVCMRCSSVDIADWDDTGAPECLNCLSNRTRPNVVLFGENLNKKLYNGCASWAREVDAVVSVGTSLNVWPATSLVFDNVDRAVVINKDKTPLDKYVKKVYRGDCDELIDKVLADIAS